MAVENNRVWWEWRPAVLAAALVFMAATGCAPSETAAPDDSASTSVVDDAAPKTDAAVGQPETAPSVTVVDAPALAKRIQGEQGKVLVVNFWATWCPPCVDELPQFTAFHSEMDPKTTAFLSVSIDDPSSMDESVEPFLKEHALGFPVLVFGGSPDDLEAAVDVGDGFTAVPATLIYDSSGKLVESWNQEVTADQVRAAVKTIADGKA